MSGASKQIEQLRVSDLRAHPVWQFTEDDDDEDETSVRPVQRIPVASLAGKLIGTQVVLANGKSVWALIGNIDETNPKLTQHFITLAIERDGRWFNLARYHDSDYKQRGPKALAKFLGLPLDQVFPMKYDVRTYATGKADALAGLIPSEPLERLSRKELIAMAIP